MNRQTVIAAIGVFFLLCSAAGAAWIDPNLQQVLRSARSDEAVNVYVTFTDTVDLKAMTSDARFRRMSRAQRHYQVITELQDKAYETQESLLNEAEADGDVFNVRPFWITNAVAVSARPSYIDRLKRRPEIQSIYLDVPIELIEPTGDLILTSDASDTIEPGIVNSRAPELWDLGIDGTGTLACDQDTGADGTHPAFADRWRGLSDPDHPEYYWFDPVGHETFPTDSGYHGTHTMGTMLGDDHAGNRVGMAPGAEWIGAKTIDVPGGNIYSDAVAAFEWAADPDGNPATIDDVPDVVNNSWGIGQSWGGSCRTDFNASIDGAEASGVVVVFAAGNEGPDAKSLRSPGNRIDSPFNTFAIGALQQGGRAIADFSSRGPSDCDSATVKPEISAIGVSVRSSEPSGQYGLLDGTSMATPHVAGAVLLLRQAFPDAGVEDIKFALWTTAVDLGAVGEDNVFGNGRMDVYEAYIYLLEHLVKPSGRVTIDPHYSCEDTITIRVSDSDLSAGSITVNASSTTEPAGKTVTLSNTGTAGMYLGSIDTRPVAGATTLQAADGDTITVTYIDADDGAGGHGVAKTDTASADCTPPDFAGLTDAQAGDHVVTLTWDAATDDLSVSYNIYRSETPHGADLGTPITNAKTSPYEDWSAVNGLTYYYIVRAADAVGNEDDNDIEFEAAPVGPDWVFFEDFEGADRAFADWTVIDGGSSTDTWSAANTGGRESAQFKGTFAIADKNAIGFWLSMDEQMITPAIDLSNYTDVTVAFAHRYVSGLGDKAAVDYSFDGTNWVNLKTFNWPQERLESYEVPDLDGRPQVFIRFHYTAGFMGQYWGVDNIRVTGWPVPTTTTTTTTTTTIPPDDDTGDDDTVADDTQDDSGDDVADDTASDDASDDAGDDADDVAASGDDDDDDGGCCG